MKAAAVAVATASLLVACGAPAPTEPTPTRRGTESEQVLEEGRAALRDAGLRQLTFGITPYLDPETLGERYQPILTWLQARMDVQLELVMTESYADMELQAAQGSIDLAVLPPYAYVRAQRQEPGLQVFATHIADGSPTYGSYIITAEDGPVRVLADVRGRSFGFVDPSSTSGWLFPADRMLDEGIHPLRDLDAVFLGGHDIVFDSVLDGRVAAGAVYASALAEGRERNPLASRIRVLAKTHRIPLDAYVARADFPPAAARAFGVALSELSTRTPEGRRVLSTFLRINGFLPVDDAHYEIVREVERRVLEATGEVRPSVEPPPVEQDPSAGNGL